MWDATRTSQLRHALRDLKGVLSSLATLHWDERIPRELKYDGKFWVGPMDECIDPHGSIRGVGQETKRGVQMSC